MSSEKNQIKQNKEDKTEEISKSKQKAVINEGEADEETSADTEVEADTDAGEDSIEQQLEQAQATIKDYWDQIIRLKAEMENNRKRAGRDIENAHKFALRNFAESLLPVLDSMEMGQKVAEADNPGVDEANPDSANLSSIVEGAQLTMSMFVQVLEKHGLKQIDPVGELFDPERHQAISMLEDDSVESNTIIEVMQKGFLLNDRLVRPAMVVVAK